MTTESCVPARASMRGMGTDEAKTLQQALTPDEVAAANELTRRWLISRAEVPAVASGFGIWPLLAMLATGAGGRTRRELLNAAGLDRDAASRVPAALIRAARTSPSIRLAVAAWAGKRVTLDPEWAAGLPMDAVGSLTGDRAADEGALDAWASRNTDGRIERMPISLSDQTDLVLASALVLRTKWITPFHEQRAPFASGPWTEPGRCQVLTATLREDVLRVADDATVLTVPGDGGIDFLLGLGRDGLAPRKVMARLLDAAGKPAWGRSATQLAPGARAVGVEVREYEAATPQTTPEIDVRTVAFRLSDDLNLIEDAAVLGIKHASTTRADFSGLAAQKVKISQARQSCVAEFDAEGFEAAVVTAFGMDIYTGAPMQPIQTYRHVAVTATFDRPFAYLARHRPSGLILVGGWVAEPGG